MHDYIALPYMFADSQAPVIVPDMPGVESLRAKVPSAAEVKEKVFETTQDVKDAIPSVEELRSPGSLRRLLSQRRDATFASASSPESADESALVPATEAKALVVHHDGDSLSTELHHDEVDAERQGRRWEELEHEEKESWKRRLLDAGEWAVEEGETVLKGVFFSEVAGFVGGVVGGLAGGG